MSAPARRASARTITAAPAWTLTAVLGLVYLILAPPSPDLAAASYRSDLFSRDGFTLWDNAWYGGHHLLAYSLLAPALGALRRPAAAGGDLDDGRDGAVRAADRGALPGAGRRASRRCGSRSALRSRCSPAASPSTSAWRSGSARCWRPSAAGAGRRSAADACSPRWRAPWPARSWRSRCSPGRSRDPRGAGRPRCRWRRSSPIGLLVLVFPEGGTQPFVASAFYPALAGVLVIGALIAARSSARCGSARALYAARADRRLRDRRPPWAATSTGSARWRPGRSRRCVLAGSGADAARRTRCWSCSRRCCSTGRPTRRSRTSRGRLGPGGARLLLRPLLGELRALGVGYGARRPGPRGSRSCPTADHWEARWVGAPRDDRARLGAPARPLPQRALLRRIRSR